MSLFDLAGEILGNQEGTLGGNPAGSNQNALSAVLSMVNNHPGGLPGLVSAFEQGGLGGVAASWVQPGMPNQPVSGDQVQNVLGCDQIQEVAAKLGLPAEAASAIIAQVLPGIIDHLTPGGQVPTGGSNLLEMGESLFKAFDR